MVEAGLAGSRTRAARLVRERTVTVDGKIVTKPSLQVTQSNIVTCEAKEAFVGRGGEKCAAALKYFQISPESWTCLDVGASTGGFTDCLLQQGAAKVVAIDVGHGQLDSRIASDSRVCSLEGINARHLKPRQFEERFELITIDVSFISLTLVLPAVLAQSGGAPTSLIALIKPQFELNSDALNGKGIVKNDALRQIALERILSFFSGLDNWSVQGWIHSPVIGGDGNREYLLHATEN